MNERRSERLLVSNSGRKWKENPTSSLFWNLNNVGSLLPSVDFNSFHDAHFDSSSPKDAESPANNKPRESLVDYLSAELVEQSSRAVKRSRKPVPEANSLVRRRGSARRMCLRPATVSPGDVFRRSECKASVHEMMRAGRVDHTPSAQAASDIPLASTSGRVSGEFWNERRRGRNSFDYQPFGSLYNSRGEDGFRSHWELPQGMPLEENVRIDENHSVSTGFQQGKQVDERSTWLSTSHKLGVNHVLATQFANDPKGGNNFNVNTTHNLLQDSTLSTNLYTNAFGECSLDVEVQREKKRGNKEVLESIMANLRTGEMLLKLQSRDLLNDIVYMHSFVSNLRGQHALRFMATVPIWRSGFVSSSFATDLHGSQKFCMNAMQKVHDQIMVGASLTTDLRQEDSISLEAKHQLDGAGNLVLKLAKDRQGVAQWDVTTSLTTKRNSWLWTYKYKDMQVVDDCRTWRVLLNTSDLIVSEILQLKAGPWDWNGDTKSLQSNFSLFRRQLRVGLVHSLRRFAFPADWYLYSAIRCQLFNQDFVTTELIVRALLSHGGRQNL